MKHYALYIITLISIVGCKNSQSDNNGVAYFGGEIINPKSDNVIFYSRDGKISDTLALDNNSRFSGRLDNITPGVYYFRHGGEIQLVIMEPSDSVMIRLNTYDFDESLVFTGKGARKNNYLLKTYNQNFEQNQKLVKHSVKEPEIFEAFVNERHQNQLRNFNNFTTKKDISEFSKSIIKANIDYNNYADKEIYPFAYFGNNKLVHVKDLPESFYAHRKNIDLNAPHLSEVFGYNRFLFSYFDNIALKAYYKDNAYHSKFNRHAMVYNKAKLDLIDSLAQVSATKNLLLKYKTRDFISHSESKEEIDEILVYYLSKTSDKKHIEEMNALAASMNNLTPGKGLPDLTVLNINQNVSTIANLVNKPTLIYFWSSNNKKHYRNSHYRVKELKTQFPEMSFMSININDNSNDYWIETLNKYKFDLDNEYRFKDLKSALKTLAVNYVYKVIIVDEKANIVHSNVNIFNDDFETTLKDILQKKELSL